MSVPTLGIVGGGTVGHATARAFTEFCPVRVYDTDPTRRTHGFLDTMDSDLVMLCLPTPALPDGSCDTSVLDKFFDHLVTNLYGDKTMVIRSTVPIGYTKRLSKRFRNVLHSPEFLTARCAVLDAALPSRNIVGIPDQYTPGVPGEGWRVLYDLYAARWNHIRPITMTSSESEAVKLFTNGFFAVKVSFWNECYQLCERLGLEYETVISAVRGDGRIHPSHTQVPGPDGKLGFGGACLPKDLHNLVACMNAAGLQATVLVGAYLTNELVRKGAK